MTPSFLEHWAQRDFGVAAESGLEQSVVTFGDSDFNGFNGVVIMVIHWLGSTITAHQFFKGVP
jgi:hypothetical protein